MNNLEIIKKNLTPDVKFVVNEETGDSIMLKTFNMAQQSMAAELAPRIEALKSEDGKVTLDTNIIIDMTTLLASVIERSCDGLSEEDIDNFVAGHLHGLMSIIEKLVPNEVKNVDKVKERIRSMSDGKSK